MSPAGSNEYPAEGHSEPDFSGRTAFFLWRSILIGGFDFAARTCATHPR